MKREYMGHTIDRINGWYSTRIELRLLRADTHDGIRQSISEYVHDYARRNGMTVRAANKELRGY